MKAKLPENVLYYTYKDYRVSWQRRNGPRYSVREWFGVAASSDSAFVKRLQRAVVDLEDAGLITVTHRIVNLKLTNEGMALVRQIRRRDRAAAKAIAILKSRPVSPPKNQAL